MMLKNIFALVLLGLFAVTVSTTLNAPNLGSNAPELKSEVQSISPVFDGVEHGAEGCDANHDEPGFKCPNAQGKEFDVQVLIEKCAGCTNNVANGGGCAGKYANT